jgi:hypothetical protein
MTPSRFVRRLLLALCWSVIAASVFAQTQATQKPFKPEVGQAGKDVVWVPTPQATVDTMLNMAKVTPQDYLIDLGSGDGRTVITAAKRGARALGIEYNPDMVDLSKRNAAQEGVTDRATFMKADLFESDFSKATVISMFLLPSINMKLRPKILDLKPGTRIVSNTFDMEDWTPDETVHVTENCESWCTALLWIVPAKVDGTWRLPQGELAITQSFQMISGTLASGGSSTSISGKLRGDEITFTAGSAQYTGHVNGSTMEGTVTGDNGGSWKATRAAQ